ncbi:hypothetical protein C5Y97_03645 [Blastopirellula marina]|uniref:Uncharacterized protein n=1 Tax=Blastopirellula marina TaxID=124 RepID=A0A2S8GA65_9BACT|nr:hypothetical protein C5Y98_03645 [Blastopirellula marina]PTL46076.1 hypothetical protein C5Y97_03645 [Blastopirellula marina]
MPPCFTCKRWHFPIPPRPMSASGTIGRQHAIRKRPPRSLPKVDSWRRNAPALVAAISYLASGWN